MIKQIYALINFFNITCSVTLVVIEYREKHFIIWKEMWFLAELQQRGNVVRVYELIRVILPWQLLLSAVFTFIAGTKLNVFIEMVHIFF